MEVKTKNNYIVFVTLLLFIIYSCGSSFKGEIEERELNKVYLVNKSTSKYFQFTIKVTKVTDDSLYDYETRLIKLAPGDEKYLGNFIDTSDFYYFVIESKVLKIYFPTIPTYEEVISDSGRDEVPAFLGRAENLPDTIYNGEKIKRQYTYGVSYNFYQCKDELGILIKLKDTVINGSNAKFEYIIEKSIDSLHPVFNRYNYKYEIKGQIEIADDIKTKK